MEAWYSGVKPWASCISTSWGASPMAFSAAASSPERAAVWSGVRPKDMELRDLCQNASEYGV
eukprot:6644679-Prymnesium_polylepis.1